ncbi:MAG: hypothetical protein ACYCPP_04785 [Nitrososphaerales archaeon]
MALLLPQHNLALSDLEAAYVACAIDTEGTIYSGLHRNTNTGYTSRMILVYISNTNKEWIEYLHTLLPFMKIYTQAWTKKSTKDCYRLVSTRMEDLLVLLKRLEPFLRIKKIRAQQAITWIETRRTLNGYLNSSNNKQQLVEMRSKLLRTRVLTHK